MSDQSKFLGFRPITHRGSDGARCTRMACRLSILQALELTSTLRMHRFIAFRQTATPPKY